MGLRIDVAGAACRELLEDKLVSNPSLESITLDSIENARSRIEGSVLHSPLVRLNIDSPGEIYLKLENLQPTGSFKVRGACNAVAVARTEARSRGVYTCSAGNMAQALAWQARENGIACTVIVPDNAPETKLQAIKRFGAKIVQVSFDEVWKVVTSYRYGPLEESVFIHPFADPRMIAGNGTIGLEVLEQLPEVDSIVIPFGGGGLTAGIATAVSAKSPGRKVYAVEPETAAPLAASFKAGRAGEVNRIPSFVDGIGGKSVLPEMWKLVRPLIRGSIIMSLGEIASAVRLLAERNRVIAEGAGAAPVAAALSGQAGDGKIVCIVSGGNIDSNKLVKILSGGVP